MQQATTRNYQQEYSDEMHAWQKATPFPIDEVPLPPNFFNIIDDGFAFVTPPLLKVDEDDFKRLQELEGAEINLLDMGTVLFVLEARTREEYGWEKDQYLQYRQMLKILTATWRKVCEVKAAELRPKYDALIEEEKKQIKGQRTDEILKNSNEYKAAKNGNNIPLRAKK